MAERQAWATRLNELRSEVKAISNAIAAGHQELIAQHQEKQREIYAIRRVLYSSKVK